MKHFHCKWDSRLYYCLKIEKVKKLGRRQSGGIDQPEATASRGRKAVGKRAKVKRDTTVLTETELYELLDVKTKEN